VSLVILIIKAVKLTRSRYQCLHFWRGRSLQMDPSKSHRSWVALRSNSCYKYWEFKPLTWFDWGRDDWSCMVEGQYFG